MPGIGIQSKLLQDLADRILAISEVIVGVALFQVSRRVGDKVGFNGRAWWLSRWVGVRPRFNESWIYASNSWMTDSTVALVPVVDGFWWRCEPEF